MRHLPMKLKQFFKSCTYIATILHKLVTRVLNKSDTEVQKWKLVSHKCHIYVTEILNMRLYVLTVNKSYLNSYVRKRKKFMIVLINTRNYFSSEHLVYSISYKLSFYNSVLWHCITVKPVRYMSYLMPWACVILSHMRVNFNLIFLSHKHAENSIIKQSPITTEISNVWINLTR